MNQIPIELRRQIAESEKISCVISELQDIQGMTENSEIISKIEGIIMVLSHD